MSASEFLSAQTLTSLSRFGDNDYEEWSDFLQEYSPPPYNLPGHTPALSFGVAGPGSGVPFHTHGFVYRASCTYEA